MPAKPDPCTLCMQLFAEPEDENVIQQVKEYPINDFMMHVQKCETCFMATSQKYAREPEKWANAMEKLTQLAMQFAKEKLYQKG